MVVCGQREALPTLHLVIFLFLNHRNGFPKSKKFFHENYFTVCHRLFDI